MRRVALFLSLILLSSTSALAQDTIVVQTLTLDSIGRSGVFEFPPKDGTPYEKVIMQYRMRCKGARVSTQKAPNDNGCGEWDYNCETFITDSSRVDSVWTDDKGWVFWPQRYQIMSFVTPYGLGLDLGKQGKMWEFDMTDYLPILHGRKRLSVEGGGQNQEELDIRFLFIKGTPVRPVVDILQIWPVTREGDAAILNDSRFPGLMVALDPLATHYKIRSTITGHGQNGEFVPRSHIISVNSTDYAREVWKECAENPVYPQGGTWVFDRAGWCPGMASDIAEFELPGLTPGTAIPIEYSIDEGLGESNFQVSNQLVSYGAPSFSLDAAVLEVRRPSERVEFARFNPACDLPVIVLRNQGTEALTALDIEYYVEGGPHSFYTWTGNLPFLGTREIVLPVDSIGWWGAADSGVFVVTVSNPNSRTDQYERNNTYRSSYKLPPTYKGAVVLAFKSNNVPEQNFYEIRDMAGNVIIRREEFEPATYFYDSLALPTGCYTFRMNDEEQNGIHFWFHEDQGRGILRLNQDRRGGKLLKTFNPDFGKFVQYDFAIENQSIASVNRENVPYRRVSLYPNPAKDVLTIELEYVSGPVRYEIIDVRGAIVGSGTIALTGNSVRERVSVEALSEGAYTMLLYSNEGTSSIPFVK